MSLPLPGRRARAVLAAQRMASGLTAPLWAAAVTTAITAARLRFEDLRETRRTYRALRAQGGPLLVCANHLTLVDSFLVAWVLGSPLWFLAHFAALPWNVPEATIFARTPARRLAIRLLKCIPIVRGGEREAMAETLRALAHLLRRGEAVLIFPEGGRSRTGGVDVSARTWATGRLVRAVPGCRVLCVYLRGTGQHGYSDLPRRGERFRVAISCFEPKSERNGLRAAVEVSEQVLQELARLEARATPGGPA